MVLTPLLLALAGVACALGAARLGPRARLALGLLLVGLLVVGLTRPAPGWIWLPMVLGLPAVAAGARALAGITAVLLLGASFAGERVVFEAPACLAGELPAEQVPAHPPRGEWGAPDGFRPMPSAEIEGPQPSAEVELLEVVEGRAQLEGCRAPGLVRFTSSSGGQVLVVAGRGPAIDEDDRRMRSVVVPSEAGVVVEVDIAEVLRGGWDSEGELCALEISAGIDSLELLHPLAAWRGERASIDRVELEGIVRPSWVLNPGVSVIFPPDDGRPRVLSWVDGGLGDGERTVVVNGEEHVSTGAGWGERFEVALEGVAEIELRYEGEGVGVFGDLAVREPPQDAPSVLVVLVDTLRDDHLGRAPAWQGLADEGVRFAFTNSASPWTKPSIPTLMSGVWPTRHRVGAQTITDRVPEGLELVQERFRRGGWATASFAASPLGSTLTGLDRGFEAAYAPRYWGLDREHGDTPTDEEIYATALEWWGQQQRPAFLYLHLLDVHQYYVESGRSHEAYLSAIEEADATFAAFFAEARERGLLQDTLVVLTSDHGEAFFDHGATSHGTNLSQSQLQVPLVFWHPERLASGLRTQLDAARDQLDGAREQLDAARHQLDAYRSLGVLWAPALAVRCESVRAVTATGRRGVQKTSWG